MGEVLDYSLVFKEIRKDREEQLEIDKDLGIVLFEDEEGELFGFHIEELVDLLEDI